MTDVAKYKLNHTMIRIKDPKVTVDFYKKNFGMSLIRKIDQKEANFSLYFLGFDSQKSPNHGRAWYDREGLLELTHNYGTENDPSFKVNNGNAEPNRGFGHIAFTVDNIEDACSKLEKEQVKFQKRLSDGRQHNIAFALDPDGYWIELIGDTTISSPPQTRDLASYKFNHSMIRIKDPEESLKFYQDVLGMKLLRKTDHENAKFTLFFLGYENYPGAASPQGNTSGREGLLELTWNWGTEKDPKFKYHNGNDEPQGFGHVAIVVDDIQAACKRFQDLGTSWKKRLTDGRMKNIAFLLDPDGYWIEVLENEALKQKI